MKNLRKVLALVLVVAMMASLVISASALSAKDYTDYSEVVNKDAVAMLTELGIINGYPAGDFQPAGVVTRAEMAKMIYVVLNSGNDQAPTPDAQRYSDVYKGHWAEGYVAFCDDLGIIDGMGDGTFAPSAPVTGVQAAKMLLVAMGYDSAVEGFTGTNWDYGVLKAASAAGLFEGFTASVNEGCTRDNAALLVYNALIGDCVSYVGNTAVATGDTLIGTCYGLVAVTGVVVANEYANLFDDEPIAAGYTEIAFIGDQYVDLAHAIDPMVPNWADLAEYPVADLALISGAWRLLPEELEEYFDVMPGEEALEAWSVLQQKVSVNDKDEYESYVYNVGTSLADIGTTVTVYAKLKGNYEQFTNIVEYAKYDMFSGKVVGNVVADDDCVVFYNEGAAGNFAGEFKTDDNTRYFENYAAVWAEVDGERVYAFDYADVSGEPEHPYAFYFEEFFNAVRGEYLWAIDVDGDGVVEIVLKYRQTFAVAEYDDYFDTWTFDSCVDKDGNSAYYVEVEQEFGPPETVEVTDCDLNDWTDIPAADVVFDGEELKAGMKVLVVPVDGTYYVKEAASLTAKASEVFYNKEAKEWAVELDGTKYFESGLYWADDIKVGAAKGPDEKAFFYAVNAMNPDVEYKVYFDDFGNIVAYEKVGMPAMTDYFLVTGAAYEVQALNVAESIVFGAKASKDTVIGAEAYYVGRAGRANTVIDDVASLYYAGAQSIDKIGVKITTGRMGETQYQYVSYQNVFEVANDYNVYGDQAGLYTSLTKVGFSEDGAIVSMGHANTNPEGMVDRLRVWNVPAAIDVTNPALGGDGNLPAIGYVGADTLFYIYMVDKNLNQSNVITLTGYKNLPKMFDTDKVYTDASGDSHTGYGIENVYGVPGGGPTKDAAVVVFELNVDFNAGYGLPVKTVSNFIYVYDVDSWATGFCKHVYGINENGEMIDLYVDTYDLKPDELDKDAHGWYSYTKTDANTECTKGHDHYVLSDKAVIDVEDVYDNTYMYEAGLLTDSLNYIGTQTHDGKYELVTANAFTGTPATWVDLSNTKLYIHCDNGSEAYNAQELIPTNFKTVEAVEKSGKLDLMRDIFDDMGNKIDAYAFNSHATVVYKQMGPDVVVIAVIVEYRTDDPGAESYAEMAHRYEVKEADASALPAGDPMAPPPPPGT